MNYRHAYHAGNFADVLKHVVLVELIKSLRQKDKPFFYLDTHAGRGIYDLASVAALKTHEADAGIKRLQALDKIPPVLEDYMNAVKACQHAPNDYPGSPLLVRSLLREGDRMAVSELHTQDYECLKELFARDRQVLTFHQDAYQSLKALLPSTPRRGLILIDPAFEVTDEFDRIIKGLQEAIQRFQTGVYVIWYPVKEKREVARFQRKLKGLGLPLLNAMLQPFTNPENEKLNETGIAILNPPWQFDVTLKKIMPVLWKILSPKGAGHYRIDKLGK